MTTSPPAVPAPIREAIEFVRKAKSASDFSGIRVSGDQVYSGWFELNCVVRPDVPVESDFPPRVEIRILIHPEFPYGGIEVFPVSEAIRYYPHQDGETGKLCLQPDQKALLDSSRLSTYIGWATEWLADAAADNLLKAGDLYELPDFGGKFNRESPTFLFREDCSSFEFWRPRFGTTGSFEYVIQNNGAVAFVRMFRAHDQGRSIDWGSCVSNDNRKRGIWILCSGEPVIERRRPALQLSELSKTLQADGIRIRDAASTHWDLAVGELGRLPVLLGFPIPPAVGAEPNEIHWQPLFLENWAHPPKKMEGGFKHDKNGILSWSTGHPQGFLYGNKHVAWGRSTNASPDRMFARGSLPEALQHAAVALIGCGALGCKIAEMLVRGGVRQITVFDPDTLQPGNLVRHNCGVGEIQNNKAQALARRLEDASLHVRVSAYPLQFPPKPGEEQCFEALKASQVWMDFTGNERIFSYLNQLSQSLDKTLIHAYITWGATFLCASSGTKRKSCRDVHDVVMSERGKGAIPESFFAEPKHEYLVIEGPGCWHPTFPAAANSIDHLASGFVSQLARLGPRALTMPWGIVIGNPWADSQPTATSLPLIWFREFP